MKKLICAGVISLGLAGCVTMLQPQDSISTYKQVTFKEDKYKGTRTYAAPTLYLKPMKYLDTSTLDGFLRLIKNDNSESYCLYATYESNGWAFFDTARDSDAKPLEVVRIDQRIGTLVSKTNVQEDMCIVLSRKYLEEKKDTGLNIKIIGKRDEIAFQVPAYYIQGFLQAVDLVEKNKYGKKAP